MTNGVTDTKVLLSGRLWARVRRCSSFMELGIVIARSTKSFMYRALYKAATTKQGLRLHARPWWRAPRMPGKAPVFTTVDAAGLVIVLESWIN